MEEGGGKGERREAGGGRRENGGGRTEEGGGKREEGGGGREEAGGCDGCKLLVAGKRKEADCCRLLVAGRRAEDIDLGSRFGTFHFSISLFFHRFGK